jgi:calcineurin-like phosphoesterase family protein
MIYFTSDTHFGHRNIIEYCNRPFRSSDGQPDVYYMDRELIKRWNDVVTPDDTVYHLGDVIMGERGRLPQILRNLSGRKILIRGNHDKGAEKMLEAGFDEVHSELYTTVDGKLLYLHHQPMPVTHWMGWATYHICGHVHEHWTRRGDTVNAGVDRWDFRPVTLETLLGAQEDWTEQKQLDEDRRRNVR